MFARARGVLLLHLGESDVRRSSAFILEITAIFWAASFSWACSRTICAQTIERVRRLGSCWVPFWAADLSRCIFVILDPAHVCSTWWERWKPLLEASMAVPRIQAILIVDGTRLIFAGMPFRCALCGVHAEHDLCWGLLLLLLTLQFCLCIKAVCVFSDCFAFLQFLTVCSGYKSRHHNLVQLTGTWWVVVMWLHLVGDVEILNRSKCTPLRALSAVSYGSHWAIILVLCLYAVCFIQVEAGKIILRPVDWQHFCKLN